MYEGVAEQLFQFIALSTPPPSPPRSTPITPFTFHHHHSHHHYHGNNTFVSSSNQQKQEEEPHIIHHHSSVHHHHHPVLSSQPLIVVGDESVRDTSNNLVTMERELSMDTCTWSNDEVIALLKIGSTLENWFHDFTNWDHVSRKMTEHGFNRSAEKCKEKYDEESRFFNMNTTTTHNNNNKNKYMFLSELEELFHGDNDNRVIVNKQIEDENNNVQNPNENVQGRKEDQEEQVVVEELKKSHDKKKYRKRKFEMMKYFCEGVVRNIMAQQEELYNKILEDMVKRDAENIAREEAWKRQEIDRYNKEVEIRANEQAIACERQASINEFFENFTFSSQDSQHPFRIEIPNSIPSSSNIAVIPQNPSSSPNKSDSNVPTSQNLKNLNPKNDTLMFTPNLTQNPNSLKTPPNNPSTPTSNSQSCHQPNQNPNFGLSYDEDKDYSKRWPREEVLALINLRSNFNNTSEEKEGSVSSNNKGPFWEKISQGMIELGYKRNAKRCKEKWENINKYYRKTKDINANKKRSLNSRTCPYFHQLSNLYRQETPSNLSEIQLPPPENNPKSPESHPKIIKRAQPSFDFEF